MLAMADTIMTTVKDMLDQNEMEEHTLRERIDQFTKLRQQADLSGLESVDDQEDASLNNSEQQQK